MDGSRDYHNEWSKPDRVGEISYDISYVLSKKKWYKWKTERDLENKHGCQRDGTVSKFAMDRYTLFYLK